MSFALNELRITRRAALRSLGGFGVTAAGVSAGVLNPKAGWAQGLGQ